MGSPGPGFTLLGWVAGWGQGADPRGVPGSAFTLRVSVYLMREGKPLGTEHQKCAGELGELSVTQKCDRFVMSRCGDIPVTMASRGRESGCLCE